MACHVRRETDGEYRIAYAKRRDRDMAGHVPTNSFSDWL